MPSAASGSCAISASDSVTPAATIVTWSWALLRTVLLPPTGKVSSFA